MAHEQHYPRELILDNPIGPSSPISLHSISLPMTVPLGLCFGDCPFPTPAHSLAASLPRLIPPRHAVTFHVTSRHQGVTGQSVMSRLGECDGAVSAEDRLFRMYAIRADRSHSHTRLAWPAELLCEEIDKNTNSNTTYVTQTKQQFIANAHMQHFYRR